LNFALAADTRIGARLVNQDRIGHWRTARSLLMVVADGLGGHLRGELAAQISIDYFGAAFERDAGPVLENPPQFLYRGLIGAHAAILRQAHELRLPDVPRTVIVACVVQDGYAYWAHVGDCRLYLVRQGRICAQTRDHTVVQHLLNTGRIREDAASSHPERNRILQCLGGYSPPRPDPIATARLARDDLLMLCSDGLWGPLTHQQMLHSLGTLPLRQALDELVVLAEQRAGPQCDNVSVLAMSWGEDEVASGEAPSTMPDYQPASDVQDATEPDFLRMSDEDIEKAIADIKAALRKTNQ
jgi:serine/threonine protein phosphatase PrpC